VVKYETYGVCGSAGGAGTGVAGTGVGTGVKVGVADGVDTMSGAALANEAEGRRDGATAVWLWLERNATAVDARATLTTSTRRPATAGRFIASTRRFIAITYKTLKASGTFGRFGPRPRALKTTLRNGFVGLTLQERSQYARRISTR
jgi:hypothetical protein